MIDGHDLHSNVPNKISLNQRESVLLRVNVHVLATPGVCASNQPPVNIHFFSK